MNRLATIEVLGLIGNSVRCTERTGALLEVLYSTEVHSSHPEVGERALVFLQTLDGFKLEAVYGRSYWRLREVDNVLTVEVVWRNRFLLEPLMLESGEQAFVPLSAIERLWERSKR